MRIWMALLCLFLYTASSSQSFKSREFSPDIGRDGAVTFTLGGQVYVGLGQSGASHLQDFYQVDPTNGTVTSIAGFPGVARRNAVAFVLGDSAYVGSGIDASDNLLKDFYAYHAASNVWRTSTSLPLSAEARESAVAFELNDLGYVGSGKGSSDELADFWQYDPASITWTQVASLDFKRRDAVAFVVGGKAFVSGGVEIDGGTFLLNDLLEYDEVLDEWDEKLVDGINLGFRNAAAFTLGAKAYIAYGNKDDVVEYDPIANEVSNLGDLLLIDDGEFGDTRVKPIAFHVGDTAYFGLGSNGFFTTNYFNDLHAIFDQDPFITTWKTDNPGVSTNTQITIPTTGPGYDYTVKWQEVGNSGNNGIERGLTENATIDFPSTGTYRVEIFGDFPRIYFNQFGDNIISDAEKILSVEQWGDMEWTSMNSAFRGCKNLSINASDNPDLSQVTDMAQMFENASSFNQSIADWDVQNVTNMRAMFQGATAFNQPLSNWNVSKVTNMGSMFSQASSFDQPIGNWDVGTVTNMGGMFASASAFNQPLADWDVQNVTSMGSMFRDAAKFNQPIGSWDVSKNEIMSFMFFGAKAFNQPIGDWNVSNVTAMDLAFNGAISFNQPIGSWDVSNVTNMDTMFGGASAFNQPIGNWDVSQVTNMQGLFGSATAFNQPLLDWEVDQVTTMRTLFQSASSFNQDLSDWDVSKVTDMSFMLNGAGSFDQSLGDWDVSSVTDMSFMLSNTDISISNYESTLEKWADLPDLETGVTVGVDNLSYCDSNARQTLITNFLWVFEGDTEGQTFSSDVLNLPDATVDCQLDSLEPPTATSACLGTFSGTTDTSFPISQSTSITWTYDDGNGNIINQIQNVIIQTQIPTPDVETLDLVTTNCQLDTIAPPTATSLCDGTITATTSTVFPITSSQTISWTYTDSDGQSNFQSQEVEITDLDAPVPDTETLPAISANCTLDQPDAPTATTCSGTVEGVAGNTFPVSAGDIEEILWTYTDESGNIITQTQVIVWEDLAPVPDVEELETVIGDCGIDFVSSPTATDDCDGLIEGTTETTFPIEDLTIDNIVWTYEDKTGNITTQTQEIVWSECILSVQGLESNLLSIFPNPVDKSINLRNPFNEDVKIIIINSAGQIVLESETSGSSAFDVDFAPGIYVLNVIGEKSFQQLKFLKK